MLIKQVPHFYQENDTMIAIFAAQEKMLGRVRLFAENAFKNKFVDTADENGIAFFERRYSIYPNETQTLDERRNVVLSKMAFNPPFSERAIRRWLDTLVDGYSLSIDRDKSILLLQLPDTISLDVYKEIKRELMQIIPASMDIHVAADVPFTWSYLLKNEFIWGNNSLTVGELDRFTVEQLSPYTANAITDIPYDEEKVMSNYTWEQLKRGYR